MKKKICLALFLISCSAYAQQKVKLYTFYTQSHRILKDRWFLPTLKDNKIELVINYYPQECPTATVFSNGWQKSMLRKVDMILEAIEENWGDVFIYSDIDVQFFKSIAKPILQVIEGKDIVFQRDTPSGTVCNGFLACRANEYTRELWQAVRQYMIEHNKSSDQKTLNFLLRKSKNKYKVIWDYLPIEFFGGGTLNASCWSPGKRLRIPRNAIMHHANWTIGITNKLAQLAYVRNRIESKGRLAWRARHR